MKKMILVLIGITIISCSNDDNNLNSNNCDFETLISADLYENSPFDQLTIQNIEINEDCLKIDFSSGGCDGNTWELKLIDKGDIAESLPAQRILRLSLKNEELCEKLIFKELTFDISNLQIEGDEILLNIEGFNDKILYEY